MSNKTNCIVYKYGGENQDSHHFTSIETGRISRTNKKGLAIHNRKVGDYVLVISEKPDGNFRVSGGIYQGLDQDQKDVWNDPDAGYDRENIELWKSINTISVDKADMFDFKGQGTYNDNGRHASKWIDMVLSS